MGIYRIKPWEELTIRDDYMFKLIMSRKRICKQMLERILHIEIENLSYVETEKSIIPAYQNKGVRLDVYVKDNKETVYNIEMQMRRLEGDGLSKRTRYYQAILDTDLLAAGASYGVLNRTFIIFICPFDPFGAGRHIYTFRNLCIEDRALELDDGATRIFLNTKGTRDDVDDSVRAFLNYVNGVVSEDSLVQEIDEEIHRIKIEERGKVGYMFLADKIAEERFFAAKEGREEGREKGREEGREEGRIEAQLENIHRLITKLKISAEQAMDLLEIPPSERQHYKGAL